VSLSDRIRPDVEAAPWVIEEVKKLEAEVARLQKRLGDRAEVDSGKLTAAFTAGTLAAGDAMRAKLREVAVSQRLACAVYLSKQPVIYDAEDAAATCEDTPLVTEEK
jgi:hypothetical protein